MIDVFYKNNVEFKISVIITYGKTHNNQSLGIKIDTAKMHVSEHMTANSAWLSLNDDI